MSATKLAFSSIPIPALAIPDLLAGHDADELEQMVSDEIRERARLLFEESGAVPGHDEENWLRAESQILRTGLEIRESGTWLSLSASLPEASGQGIRIVVRPRRVLVRALQNKGEQRSDAPAAQGDGEILLAANLPVEADPQSAAASFRDHNLRLMIKKLQPSKHFG
jgi:HSP20 family molecular chaperone IbpA